VAPSIWTPYWTPFSGLLVGRGKKSQISRDFQGQIRGKNDLFRGNFAGIFEASFAEKTISKDWRISWELPEQISLESDWFCAALSPFEERFQ